MSKISELQAARQAQIDKFNDEIVEAFKEDLKALFEKYPDVEEFATPCYTMSFNDGDPCYYSVYDYKSTMYPTPKVPEGICEDEWYEDETIILDEAPSHELFNPLREYVILIDQIPSDVLEDLYGEGKLTFYRDGTVKINDYYHDQ